MIPTCLCFLLYDDRSGSTYFSALMANHPEVGVTIESLFLTKLLEHGEFIRSKQEIHNLIESLYSEKKFISWGIEKEWIKCVVKNWRLPVRTSKLVFEILGKFFESRKPRARVWLIKHGSIYHLRLIKRAFPEAKFISIVRDGRAVFNSKKGSKDSVNGKFMATNPVSAARLWRWRISTPVKRVENDRLLVVRYEDIIVERTKIMKEVFTFLGCLEKEKDVTRWDGGIPYADMIPDSQRHLHANLRKPPLVNRIDGWKHDLSPSEVFAFEIFAKKVLLKNGYTVEPFKRDMSLSEWIDIVKIVMKYIFTDIVRRIYRMVKVFCRFCRSPKGMWRKIWWKMGEKGWI